MIIRILGVELQALIYELEDAAGDVAVAEDADVRDDSVDGSGEHAGDGRAGQAVDEGYYDEGGDVRVAPDSPVWEDGAGGHVGDAAGVGEAAVGVG